jgi:hypothetical protein
MARDANLKPRRRVSAAAPANHIAGGNRFAAEMHSGGSGGDGNIEPIVHENARLTGGPRYFVPRLARHPARCRDGIAREIEKRSARQILFANLHPIRACLDGKTNFAEQLRNLVNGRVNGQAGGAQRQAVGYIAND